MNKNILQRRKFIFQCFLSKARGNIDAARTKTITAIVDDIFYQIRYSEFGLSQSVLHREPTASLEYPAIFNRSI